MINFFDWGAMDTLAPPGSATVYVVSFIILIITTNRNYSLHPSSLPLTLITTNPYQSHHISSITHNIPPPPNSYIEYPFPVLPIHTTSHSHNHPSIYSFPTSPISTSIYSHHYPITQPPIATNIPHSGIHLHNQKSLSSISAAIYKHHHPFPFSHHHTSPS